MLDLHLSDPKNPNCARVPTTIPRAVFKGAREANASGPALNWPRAEVPQFSYGSPRSGGPRATNDASGLAVA